MVLSVSGIALAGFTALSATAFASTLSPFRLGSSALAEVKPRLSADHRSTSVHVREMDLSGFPLPATAAPQVSSTDHTAVRV